MLSNANGAESANVGPTGVLGGRCRPWVRRRQRCLLGCSGCFASPDAIEVLFGVSKVRAAVARATVRADHGHHPDNREHHRVPNRHRAPTGWVAGDGGRGGPDLQP